MFWRWVLNAQGLSSGDPFLGFSMFFLAAGVMGQQSCQTNTSNSQQSTTNIQWAAAREIHTSKKTKTRTTMTRNNHQPHDKENKQTNRLDVRTNVDRLVSIPRAGHTSHVPYMCPAFQTTLGRNHSKWNWMFWLQGSVNPHLPRILALFLWLRVVCCLVCIFLSLFVVFLVGCFVVAAAAAVVVAACFFLRSLPRSLARSLVELTVEIRFCAHHAKSSWTILLIFGRSPFGQKSMRFGRQGTCIND